MSTAPIRTVAAARAAPTRRSNRSCSSRLRGGDEQRVRGEQQRRMCGSRTGQPRGRRAGTQARFENAEQEQRRLRLPRAGHHVRPRAPRAWRRRRRSRRPRGRPASAPGVRPCSAAWRGPRRAPQRRPSRRGRASARGPPRVVVWTRGRGAGRRDTSCVLDDGRGVPAPAGCAWRCRAPRCSTPLPFTTVSDLQSQRALEGALGLGADRVCLGLPVLEQDHVRDRLDAEALCEPLFLS